MLSELQFLAKIAEANAIQLPDMGDPRKKYPVLLTEPEINAIYAAASFIRAACDEAGLTKYWEHYGPTLGGLSERLREFDDGNAPYMNGVI